MEICQGNTVQLETKYFVSAFLMKKKKKKKIYLCSDFEGIFYLGKRGYGGFRGNTQTFLSCSVRCLHQKAYLWYMECVHLSS